MTKEQKETLRDLFEGCVDLNTAWQMANIEDYAEAAKVWNRWQREMDEKGFYTF